MKPKHCLLLSLVLPFLAPSMAHAQLEMYQPNAHSKNLPAGSSAERKARMAARAAMPAYTKKFDLSSLPQYTPHEKVSGILRICGNNYIGDSPLAGWWAKAFKKYQPGVKLEFDLRTAAIATPCIYFDKADIGINHEPSFYDYLAHLRLKGYAPTGIEVVTGSYDVVGWQNNMVIIVNKDNPLTKITMKQLDGVFGSQRAGGWIGTTWHPELSRGPEGDIRTWGQLGLTGEWAEKKIGVYGFSIDYATSMEFSRSVLAGSNKWNGDLQAFGNYTKPDGTTYLESDQIVDHVLKDPNGIGYVRFHPGFPKGLRVLSLARTDEGPYVDYTIENLQNGTYPLVGGQAFWMSVKPGSKMDPKVREFIRFAISKEGQELVQKDGKYLPLNAKLAEEGLKKAQ